MGVVHYGNYGIGRIAAYPLIMILLCANRAGRTRFVSLSAAITFLAASATAVLADSGIAARYPNDKGIGSDPDVILADDFEILHRARSSFEQRQVEPTSSSERTCGSRREAGVTLRWLESD